MITLPYTIANGQALDATPVQSNFNALATGAAAAGINSDITQLTGLTTPLAITEGGTGAVSAHLARVNLGAGVSGEIAFAAGVPFDLLTATGAALLQCQVIVSGANLLLLPLNGNVITIGGVPRQIPSAGVTLSTSGLAANTLYNIFASWNGTAIVMTALVAAHSTDTTTGMEIQTGFPGQMLVAKARTNASIAWVDSATQRFLINWPKAARASKSLKIALTTTVGVFSTGAYAVLAGSVSLLEFLSWGDEATHLDWSGYYTCNVAPVNSLTMIGVDAGNTDAMSASSNTSTSADVPVNMQYNETLSEGYHKAEIYCQQVATVSTTTYGGSATPGLRCVHSGFIRG